MSPILFFEIVIASMTLQRDLGKNGYDAVLQNLKGCKIDQLLITFL